MYKKGWNGFRNVRSDIRSGKYILLSEHSENAQDSTMSYYWMIYVKPGCDELYITGHGGIGTAFGGKVRVHEALCDGESIKGRWRLVSIGLMFGSYAVAAVKEFYGME